MTDQMDSTYPAQGSGGTEDHSEHLEGTPDSPPGIGETIARFMSGGRDQGQRALYNATRAGAYNSATVPDEAGAYGGLLPSLKTQRTNSMGEAQGIADRIRGQGPYRDR